MILAGEMLSTYSLDRDGFAVLREFLNPSEVRRTRQFIEACLHEPHGHTCTRPHNELLPLRWNDPIVQLMLGSQGRIELLRATTEAEDLRWISGYVSIKQAHSPALWWHQDWWCWDHQVSYRRAPVQVAVLCYVARTNIDNGALRVLPGSHHRSAAMHSILPEAHSTASEGLSAEHPAMSDASGQVTLSAQAGDVVIIDYRLLHGAHPNSSAVRRDCIILSFTPSWRQLPVDVKAHLIQHPAQPSRGEIVARSPVNHRLLPVFRGKRRDLILNRNAPREFAAYGLT